MSCLQLAAHDPRCGILGREGQAVHRFDHQAAGEGRGQSGLSCEEVVRECRVGLFTRPILSHLVRLNPSRRTGRNQVIQNSGDGGMP